MEEKDCLYLYEDEKIRFSFTKRDVDGKNILKLKNILKKHGYHVEYLSYVKQIHSNLIKEVTKQNIQILTEADGIITNDKNIPIVIFTADCVPIIFYDKINKVVALAHAGWRGTYSEIAKKVVEKMLNKYNCKRENINVFFAPHIRQDNYEVSLELIEKFRKFNIQDYFKVINKKYYLNLEKINKENLLKSGILEKNIKSSKLCTVRNNDKFYSYRKDKKTDKRIATIIELK